MKVAVTSRGMDMGAEVDPRFGRAAYVLIIDSETLQVEVVDNKSNVDAFKGAGIQAATMVADSGAEVLLTGYCGPNAYKALTGAGIGVVSDVSGSVAEAITNFNQGTLVLSDAPNAQGHW